MQNPKIKKYLNERGYHDIRKSEAIREEYKNQRIATEQKIEIIRINREHQRNSLNNLWNNIFPKFF